MKMLGTKAETLENLSPALQSAEILPLVRFTVGEWKTSSALVVKNVRERNWLAMPIIVRSSARGEDSRTGSLAGCYVSTPDVLGEAAFVAAVEKTIASYTDGDDENQVLVQPMLKGVAMSGVAFSIDPNTGGHYLVINYDETESTSSITGGTSRYHRTVFVSKHSGALPAAPLDRIAALVRELESRCGTDCLDVEFALTGDGRLFLLQARPLVVTTPVADARAQQRALAEIERKIERMNRPHPYLHGASTVFGIMPDWNPAEIIGVRPRPLALSLYKEIITDNIWAYQRLNYGYQNLRSFPLMMDFHGLPYIDVRVSFNSFLPRDIGPALSEKLVNYYISELTRSPASHDKVEFDIVYSCYTFDLAERLARIPESILSAGEKKELAESLRLLTNRIINFETGLWRKDIERIHELETRYEKLADTDLDGVSRIYWLLEDCKRYGTLPFAGLARAAFISVQILRSLVATQVLTSEELDAFMGSLETVSSQMTRDLHGLDRARFLAKYGHLRPGTYDLLSPRYDREPDRYFDWESVRRGDRKASVPFALSLTQLQQLEKLLAQHGLPHSVVSFFEFLKAAIEGREYAKFIFTRNLSLAMEEFEKLCAQHGFSAEDASYARIDCIRDLQSSARSVQETLQREIDEGRRRHAITSQLVLPPLITDSKDVWFFSLPAAMPNYVTKKKVTGKIASTEQARADLRGKILMIPSADPGYDWIFSLGIAGFVTTYGGVNSHMAIRAGELGIPAVIGSGEVLFRDWAQAEVLEIDCLNRKVVVIR